MFTWPLIDKNISLKTLQCPLPAKAGDQNKDQAVQTKRPKAGMDKRVSNIGPEQSGGLQPAQAKQARFQYSRTEQ